MKHLISTVQQLIIFLLLVIMIMPQLAHGEDIQPNGISYNPNQSIEIEGTLFAHTHICSPSVQDPTNTNYSQPFNAAYPLQRYGPNIVSSTKSTTSRSQLISQAWDCCADSFVTKMASVVTSANTRKIVLLSNSLTQTVGSVTTGEIPIGLISSGSGGTANYHEISIQIPFCVGRTGKLFVQRSLLQTIPQLSGTSYCYSVSGNVEWGVDTENGDTIFYGTQAIQIIDDQMVVDRRFGDQTGSITTITPDNYVFWAVVSFTCDSSISIYGDNLYASYSMMNNNMAEIVISFI